MTENLIETTLKNHISERNTVFVFPTQIAADLWADRCTLVSDVSAVPMEKFIAWDDFKGAAVRGESQNKNAVPSVMRSVFAANLIRENSEKKFLRNLIVPEFAEKAASFTDWIASLLPSLKLWKEYFQKASGEKDDEDSDLDELFERYSAFLDEHNLFDPAWERPPFKNNGNHYYLFFPEILSDWEEYKSILLAAKDFVTVVSVPGGEITNSVHVFSNSRVEIKNVAAFLWKIKKENQISWDEIAVNVPDMEVYAPYIERELELNEIPFVSKYAKPLTKTGAGNFFVQIKECIANDFDFESVKSLLLNKELPWKEKNLGRELIKFGQKNHCVCGFEYNGEKIDVWKKSFDENPCEERLNNFYSSLKKSLLRFKNASTFAEIREGYFAFTQKFFDMERCSEKSDRILGRCISELSEIIDVEANFKECIVPNPFAFFTDVIGAKKYLEQRSERGVSILPYKTACAAPFSCHVVVDASQQSLNVVYKEFSFLNEEKRLKLLKREETNVSDKFIRLYIMNSVRVPSYWTCGIKTFTGYSQVSSYLTENDLTSADENVLFENDSYTAEKKWFIEKNPAQKFPPEVMEKEKSGFEKWLSLQNDFHADDFEFAGDAVFKLCQRHFEISATLLKKFYFCPRSWAFEKLLKLKEEENAGELVDRFLSGNVYHKIFEVFFGTLKLKNLPVTFENGAIPGGYEPFIKSAVEKAVLTDEFGFSNCYLTRELLNTTKTTLLKNAGKCILKLSEVFNGCKVSEVEKEYKCKGTDALDFTGRIDCLFQDSENGQYFLVDFKSSGSGIPAAKNMFVQDEDSDVQDLPDFQMPLYVYLLKNQANPVYVENAVFFNISECEVMPVFGKQAAARCLPGTDRTEFPTIDDFQPTVDKMLECARQFADRLAAGDLRIDENIQTYQHCAGCDYKTICRKTFNVGKIKAE